MTERITPMNFTTELLGSALQMGFIGMAGVFIGMSVIYIASMILHRSFPENTDE